MAKGACARDNIQCIIIQSPNSIIFIITLTRVCCGDGLPFCIYDHLSMVVSRNVFCCGDGSACLKGMLR